MKNATRLSVNINKIATLRNSRGGNNPDLLFWAKEIETFGADGITIHPRPDERHIRYDDARALKEILTTELNIEGNPKENKFVDLVLETKPDQVTLVPDITHQLTSNHGWDTVKEQSFLEDIIAVFQKEGIRVSIFVDPIIEMIEGAHRCNTDRIELYTENYANQYLSNREIAVLDYVIAAKKANELGLGINAGHDLDLINLSYFVNEIPELKEVSIGHALISDALIYGMQNTVNMYLKAVGKFY